MNNHGKKYRNAKEKVQPGQVFLAKDALVTSKIFSYAKFDESVDAHVNLGIDASKGDQVVRGSLVLPHAKDAAVKVLVFAKGDYADQAKKAGADYMGAEDLIEKISRDGWSLITRLLLPI